MKKLVNYEGAIYYFDTALNETEKGEYDTATLSLTKGYKHITDTDVLNETDARAHIESCVNALEEKDKGTALIQLTNLINLLEKRQSDIIESVFDNNTQDH